jgi:NAD(P)-dependent dehydrogenase (short-subunit alcohol dehydrogenase family)
MPGFDLARAVSRIWHEQSGDSKRGMVLLNHGLFTYGATTREAYDRHLDLITRAETWLKQRAPDSAASAPSLPDADPVTLAGLRREISQAAGKPMIVTQHRDQAVARFVRRPDLSALAGRGPLTPDHVIRTKRVPMVGRDVGRYVKEYRAYFESHRSRRQEALVMLDPAPRVVLDPEFGMLTAGATAADTAIAADIYRHTIPVLERAQDHLGGYQALGPAEMFDCEYWDLEQAKVRRSGLPPEFTGMVGLVTGAASGIGRACAAELMKRGAAVVGFDLSPQVASMFSGAGYLGLEVDVTDRDAQRHAVAQAVERFGGIDLVVIAAGIFGEPQKLSALDLETWSRVMSVNVDSVASLYRDLDPILRLSPVGGRVAVIATRNVPAPGRGAASYSASKAALTQLSRVAALEWAAAGIRLNLVHPDAVFDTAIWTEELLTQRAKEYGLTVEEYKRRNLLGVEVDSATVAAVVADLCSDRFRATTGAQIPIDGGNERVI